MTATRADNGMRLPISSSQVLFWLLSSVPACGMFKTAAPVAPISQVTPAVGQVPDSVLEKLIRGSELIVLATPLDFMPDNGFLNPSFQLGAKETWYNVKLAVDSVGKGKLKRAKSPDLGILPQLFVPPPPFGRLAANEIVVQYPAVTFSRSEWSAAPPPIIGERAVFIFRKCWYCVTIRGLAIRGPYYKAHPLVAQSWGSKLDPAEWPRVIQLLANLQRLRKQRASSEGSRPEFLP